MNLFLILITLLLTITSYANDTLVVATANQSYANYTIIDKGEVVGGFEYELMNSLCEKMNKQCVWKTVDAQWAQKPFPGILSGLNSGQYDMAIAFMRGTLARINAFSASAPYLQTKTALFTLSQGFTYTKDAPNKLNNNPVRFAVMGAYAKSVKDLYAAVQMDDSHYEIIDAETNEEIIQLIQDGKADFAYSSAENSTLLKALKVGKVISPEPSLEWGPRIYSNNSATTSMINQALKTVVEDTSPKGYQALLKKHSLELAVPCYQDEDADDTINIMENSDLCSQ